MATMNISLPDQMKAWVEEQVASGRYANASEVVRDILRQEQRRRAAVAEMQALIDEGLASGISDRTPEQIRQDALKELGLAADDADAA